MISDILCVHMCKQRKKLSLHSIMLTLTGRNMPINQHVDIVMTTLIRINSGNGFNWLVLINNPAVITTTL
jgi:hypothetical protein